MRPNYKHVITEGTNNKSLEMFFEKIEKDLLNHENVKKLRHNLSKDEKAALKDRELKH